MDPRAALAVPKQPAPGIAERMRDAAEEVRIAVDRLEALADNLAGPRPKDDGPIEHPQGLCAILDRVDEARGDIVSQAARLHSLVTHIEARLG